MQSINKIKATTQPLLTIAIPTYNRANLLDLNLKKISEELLSLGKEQKSLIRINISNNASTDNTVDIINKYQSLHSDVIQVINNTENIGGSLNVVQCYELANTPYVWVLGDDDIILPGNLSTILTILMKQKVDILYLNHYWFKDEYIENSNSQNDAKVAEYLKPIEFAKRTHVMLTFISGLIVRTGVGNEYRDALATSNLPQFSWILPLLRDGKNFAVLENKVVAARGGNSGGYGLVQVFGENLKNITDSILKNKPDVARAIQNGTIIRFFPSLIMACRNGLNRFTNEDMGTGLCKAFGDNWRYNIFIYPLINMPLPLSRLYYLFVKVFAKVAGKFVI
jgi:abequosyltransferase